MDLPRIERLLAEQDGVVARRQVLALGGDDNDIERMIRRRRWAVVHRGVYIDHTGQLSWLQRGWAAVLFYWPAALSHQTALRAHGLRTIGDDGGFIHVAVDQGRRVTGLDGVGLHRVNGLSRFLHPSRSPARIRLEHSLLDVASCADRQDDAIAVLADACQTRRTTPSRLLAALEERPCLRHRRFLRTVLEDVAQGVYSVLERRYLLGVERPHGLPIAKRQRRVRPGKTPAYRDVEYVGLRTLVELDGRLGHEGTRDRWDDLDRDIESATEGDMTVRLGWRQVQEPCRTAVAVGRILMSRGWVGPLRPCGETCAANRMKGDVPA